MANFKINPFYIIVIGCLYPVVNACNQKHSDKEQPETKISAEQPLATPALDTAYVLDAKGFYFHSGMTGNRVYMVTKSGHEIIKDTERRKVGYFVQPGDTVLLNQDNEIITSLRHQRMKNKFVRGH